MEIDMTATLQLKSITCLQQQETFTDELYLTFKRKKDLVAQHDPGSRKGPQRRIPIRRIGVAESV
jgi:hypothetical protein